MDNETKEKEIRIFIRDWKRHKTNIHTRRHGMKISPNIKSLSVTLRIF